MSEESSPMEIEKTVKESKVVQGICRRIFLLDESSGYCTNSTLDLCHLSLKFIVMGLKLDLKEKLHQDDVVVVEYVLTWWWRKL